MSKWGLLFTIDLVPSRTLEGSRKRADTHRLTHTLARKYSERKNVCAREGSLNASKNCMHFLWRMEKLQLWLRGKAVWMRFGKNSWTQKTGQKTRQNMYFLAKGDWYRDERVIFQIWSTDISKIKILRLCPFIVPVFQGATFICRFSYENRNTVGPRCPQLISLISE